MSHLRPRTIRAIPALVVLSAAALAGCSASSASGSTTPTVPTAAASTTIDTPSAETSAAPSASAAPSDVALPSASEAEAGPTAVPTAVDPCKLVTPAEITALTGKTPGSPKASTTEGNARLCSYGNGGVGFNVIVSQLPDAATAKQQEPAFKAQLEHLAAEAGITDAKLTELPNFEPGVDAAVISGSVTGAGQKISAISLFALKGAVLVALSDVAIGGAIPTSEAMQAQGKATLARLP
jgi:hypothetical protein